MSEIIFNMGEMFVSEFVAKRSNVDSGLKFPLTLIWSDDLGCPVLTEQPPSGMMWGLYWYQSGLNAQMSKDLKDVVEQTDLLFDEKGGIWLDIASNDGTLLSHVDKKYMKVGIDPCRNHIAEECRKHANIVKEDYFSKEVFDSLDLWEKARVITCCAMFYDLQNPKEFLSDVFECLRDDGVFVMQYTYTPKMLEINDFMNICHEHYAYHNFTNVYKMMNSVGFNVFDVSENDVNGGSVRIYASKENRPISNAVKSILNIERKKDSKEVWKSFVDRVKLNRFKLSEYIHGLVRRGVSVWGYGASTKGNTLLQYYSFTSDEIQAICEVNEAKVGRFTKGTGISIVSEDSWRKFHPEYTLVLPFHFIDFILEKEDEYLNKGGVFIVPCPVPHRIQKVNGEIVKTNI